MGKIFYTEKDIEDLFNNGVSRLDLTDNTVLTGLAFEKATTLGIQLIQGGEQPPDAPVRPYVVKEAKVAALPGSSIGNKPTIISSNEPINAPGQPDLNARIKNAVTAKLGSSIDPALLETIIRRVLDQVKV